MAKPEVSKDALRARARAAGLQLSDDRLEELLPQVQQTAEATAGLDELDLEGVEPVVVFRPETE